MTLTYAPEILPTLTLVPPAAILALRASVLRAHRPILESIYPEDGLPTTFHVVATHERHQLGCCTGLEARQPLCPEATYQLRGMAVHPRLQGRGIGAPLLARFEAEARHRGATMVWCNARVSAQNFYEKQGWTAIGDVFESVELPHIVMYKSLV